MVSARLLRPALALLSLPLALSAQDNDPPARAGRVSSVAGTVAFQAAGAPDWSNAPLNYTVTSGDRLLTHQRARAEIEVGPFDVRLSDSTDVSVVTLTDDFAQLGVSRGTIRIAVYRLASRDSMEVDTPNGAIIIRSAGRYRVDVLEGVSTIVTVEDGVAELSGPALNYTVRRGQSVELTGSSAISANLVPHPRNTEFDAWSNDRDRRQESAQSWRYISRDIPGGADLDNHGHWDYHATYGYVWRPRIVHVGWVPYRYGRWVWSGPWGWTWVEDSPWGFAPFHYGRWVVVGGVWVWAPGPIVRRPYYAPALVVFVGGSRYGRHHQAWFPLGWHEPYYPRYRHSDRYLRQVNIAHVRNISNVDDFVDPRRADRIQYSNRQATTVVSSDVFGRRPVRHEAASVSADEIARAPIERSRWTGPARLPVTTGSNDAAAPDRESPFRPRREATIPREPSSVSEPVRPASNEPRLGERSPLIFRNTPPMERRRASTETGERPATTTRPTGGEIRSRQGLEPVDTRITDRNRPLIRRNEPSRISQPTGAADRPRRIGAESMGSSSPDRTLPRRVDAPRESSPSRQSSPRVGSPGSSPRASSPRAEPPSSRAPAGAAPSRSRPAAATRPPGGQE
jgi:antitoxin (DNA-binding transcriptional repressor) of toxin-antitoxin stability system